MSNEILTRAQAGVLTVSFNRVERKNSITGAMYDAMTDALAAAQGDPSVRVVVFEGHETVFSAGNDISDFLNAPSGDAPSPVLRFIHALATFQKPLLAAVCGPAVGIGTTLLFHCDMVYAGDNASFSMPFVNLGLCPEAGSSLLAPQMLGYHRAAEAFMLGEPLTAEAALAMGLVNKVLAPSEVNSHAQAQARKLAAKPLGSLLEIKGLMKKAQQLVVLQQIADESATFSRMIGEPAAKEAFTAFMEKRKPDFSAL
ncbi:enoyl-CoA hydratase [Piscinibacter sp. XHJ-5]|uniref:enoyl-CoA hydratase n=1 Tax=Piscinibacter sp. XHJ-5 TaxID=3037797 RepID=UPI002452A0DF|nr:enoyl-CoA hydratase [Piscinibacter sp. XHJ-5]